jgi:hypothetical protein
MDAIVLAAGDDGTLAAEEDMNEVEEVGVAINGFSTRIKSMPKYEILQAASRCRTVGYKFRLHCVIRLRRGAIQYKLRHDIAWKALVQMRP